MVDYQSEHPPKMAFTTAPILSHWIPNAPLVVETDTLDYGLAAILLTYTKDGELHLIAFHSCTFTSPELNYDVHDKELLAIFEAFTQWQHYLEGSGTPGGYSESSDICTCRLFCLYFIVHVDICCMCDSL